MKSVTLISATELNRHSGETLKKVAIQGEHIMVERDGYPLAVIIPVQTYNQCIGGAGGVLSESKEVGE